MAAALIQFTQGVTVGTAGQSLFGAAGAAVDVANAVNTGISSWQIELVDVPPASALTTGVKASSDNGSTPAYSFTPDVAGGYRVVLKVWSTINRAGTPTDTDIRNFGVKDAGGLYRPTQQVWPRPLPPTASGESGNKPDENNFGGQARGWAGGASDGLIAHLIAKVDALLVAGTQSQSWRMSAAPATLADRFLPLASSVGSAVEALSQVLWMPSGLSTYSIRAFHVGLLTFDTITYTLRIDGVDTALAVTVPAGQASAVASGVVAVPAGSRLTMRAVQSGTEVANGLGAVVAVGFRPS